MHNQDSCAPGCVRGIAALATAALFLLLLAGCATSAATPSDSSAAPVVAVASVTRQNLSRGLTLAAEFRPFQEVELHAKVAGYVKFISVDVGDRVKQGQLLAVLEIPELQDEIQQADASMRQGAAEIRQSQDELHRARSAYAATHLGYSRLAEAAKSRPNLIAQQELDESQGRDQVGEAQVSAAEAAVNVSEQRFEASKANRNRVGTLFSYARIIAPFTGVVTKRYADTGSMVQAGTASQTQTMPVIRLSQNDKLRLIIPVPESIVSQIHLGTPVQVRVPSVGKTIEGKVARFADSISADTRTMPTEIDVPNANLFLVPGMYAEASATLESKNNVLSVPVQALDRHDNSVSVMVVGPDGKLQVREITLGLETATNAEVISGLNENDKVVLSGRGQLRAGEKVQTKQVAETKQAES